MSISHDAVEVSQMGRLRPNEVVFVACSECWRYVARFDGERPDTVRPIGWVRRCEHLDFPVGFATPSMLWEQLQTLVLEERVILEVQGALF